MTPQTPPNLSPWSSRWYFRFHGRTHCARAFRDGPRRGVQRWRLCHRDHAAGAGNPVPPPDLTGHGSTLLKSLLGLWPSYLGYVISFVTIGVMWVNHHSMFVLIRRTDRYFLLLSVFFLMCIAFLPFPTAVLAEYLPEPKGRRVAVAAYSASFILIALAYNAAWWYAAREGRLLDPNADREAVETISKRYLIGPAAYLVSFGLAFVNVWASLAVHGVLVTFYILPVRKPTARRPAI
ncbi:MAG TPA: TMEM175 family protein [Gemmatimonadales bacterium]